MGGEKRLIHDFLSRFLNGPNRPFFGIKDDIDQYVYIWYNIKGYIAPFRRVPRHGESDWNKLSIRSLIRNKKDRK